MTSPNLNSWECRYANANTQKTVAVIPDSGYVSSSRDYFVEMCVTHGDKRRFQFFCLTGGFFVGKRRAIDNSTPKYLITEAKAKIKLAVESIKWREYDAYGNERRDNLRYYGESQLKSLVSSW